MVTRDDMVDKLRAFYSAGVEVLNGWYGVEQAGEEMPTAEYPFDESFDEVLARIAIYVESVQHWANQHKAPKEVN